MGNKKDGQHTETKTTDVKVYREEEMEKYGNSDAKALAAVYHEFTKDDNLSEKEKQALKSMDKALKGAELISGFDNQMGLITQDAGNTSFVMSGTAYKQTPKIPKR